MSGRMTAYGSAISWVHPAHGQAWQPILRYKSRRGTVIPGSYYGLIEDRDSMGTYFTEWRRATDGEFTQSPRLYKNRRIALRVANRQAKKRNKADAHWRPGQP